MSGLSKVEMSAFTDGWGSMETERIALSQRERERLKVLHEIKLEHLKRPEAAQRLKLTDRQRHWVTTAEGRRAHIGHELRCLACKQIE
jgi:hypothetical protein